jgi:hypothetical protein
MDTDLLGCFKLHIRGNMKVKVSAELKPKLWQEERDQLCENRSRDPMTEN